MRSSGVDLDFGAVPQVLLGMCAGDAYRLGDQYVEIGGVALDVIVVIFSLC
jgi:hypothetical protein